MTAAGVPPVVAGVDGSAGAARAVAFAVEEARLREAPLLLVSALSWPTTDFPVPPLSDVDVPGVLQTNAETVLRAAAEGAEAALGAGRVRWQVDERDPVDALRAAGTGAQLVVVGARGAGGVAGLLLGSTATALALDAPCPVVVLPDDTAALVTGRRSVVAGVEGRPGDEAVLAFAFAEAAARGTDLVAVHAWRDVALEPSLQSLGPLVDWVGVAADEQRLLAEALAGWRDRHPDVEVREVVVRERTAAAVVAAGLTAHLVVVGHRRRRLARLGSTTHAVLHRAGCPVAVVPLTGGAR
ncbi:universal stress protein [Geodermatophilus sabuli]|uniref:Nucleotide-binding universal stress protein, UspA family n=1 Tax=Geodermatophilus sabuli TaxID=1564158 RepID=A0A285EJ54_9ACTN|nr:universal stress protein [Geodermatophilus sabuli]MBB3083620.1 nucleotide-binding universal stress UspA family protein [Geodermatophilus sabuli]SNX99050.1 Nucleotide-binding universal stress protein, UspA family [Geodermatophilus sabuli]